LEVVIDDLVVGGSIVLDHYTTTAAYTRTIGERLAAREVLDDAGLFHLHGTGVFTRLS
jgi:hypothetical protein